MRVTDDNVDDDLSKKQMIAENLMLAMRTKDGASEQLIKNALTNCRRAKKTFKKVEELGLAKREGGRLIPTERG